MKGDERSERPPEGIAVCARLGGPDCPVTAAARLTHRPSHSILPLTLCPSQSIDFTVQTSSPVPAVAFLQYFDNPLINT